MYVICIFIDTNITLFIKPNISYFEICLIFLSRNAVMIRNINVYISIELNVYLYLYIYDNYLCGSVG